MTNHDKGTHGVLTNSNSGVTIPVTIEAAYEEYLSVRIDGVPTATNVFDFKDGWTFTPDIVLPTKIGSVVRAGGSTWILLNNRVWFSQNRDAHEDSRFGDVLKRSGFGIEVIA